MNPNEPRTPVWRPVSYLLIVFDLFGGQLEEAQALHGKLVSCRLHPHVLDDATLARIRQVYSEQREFLPVQREQFKRWQSEVSTHEQRDMLAHLTARADQLSALQDQILAVVDELSSGSIDRLMGMSDADLAAAVLSGRVNLPKR
ncbi:MULTISPECIES: hypothetical protein [Burkholderia]|uniref:hypothetical protein n=1 Tax=Burkholderia TaxID=32008 RepID=UPI000F560336|nr:MULTISPECIES: hypothetical protein [Burkholderia]MCW3639926.1 hypothetical protein [Burkholderia cenocepacia]RQR72371.1 hypothetical protein DIE10_33290 [Burkholderia sp. Bp9011]RQR84626.1 hypothetical protein DIE09_33840 [Burkholderia sp. Bp9010]RQS65617.1 hypothetical protein DID97_31760 [Burkholderia sp. Bp8977]RQU64436.1 hypothetical protein DF143_05395 [Burkholderia cenocepacia]